ncbi:ATPase [Serratia marcescens]|uniref:ATP-binding protein n=1 Tax=Serratia marcescens TaxID=615 RepID=UPI000CDE344E|nr:ATP-binding protein [Serratia marcescens]POW86008.1 ATPase [Serratia marcescens]POW90510.1 ATPase [Serratia marcescens]POX04657.1 ATPase [Serratia marcescens]POX09437.1 ATPase [Serratia marcescens]
MRYNATIIGAITAVSSSSILVELSPNVNSGLLIISGKSYSVGQVGSFVRIPQGYNNLFGIISESSESSRSDEAKNLISDKRLIKVELVGESIGDSFDRGISQYPSVNDDVHLVLEKDLKVIYGEKGSNIFSIGKLSSSDGIDVNIDLDKLLTRHSAVLGSTGSGKSTSVASLLRSIVSQGDKITFPSSRIILIDVHGEYSSALKDIAKIFSIDPAEGECKLSIPYWSVSPDLLLDFLCGPINDTNRSNIIERIIEEKKLALKANNIIGIEEEKINSFTPLPFRLKKIWFDLIFNDTVTHLEKDKITPAYKDDNSKGNANLLIPPKFKPPGTSSAPPFKTGQGILTRQLDLMRARLQDNQFSFFLNPNDWCPDENGIIKNDLDKLLMDWLGHDKPISILDLSGMPSSQLDMLLGSILDIIFQSSIWGRNLKVGMKKRPILLVMEEAHRYLSSKNEGLAKDMVQKIAKEGRKFGVGLMLVSQRPSEIDETILSQCGTLFALRISNNNDRGRVKSAMSDGLSVIIDSLPILRTGEAIIVGEAAKLPLRCRFKLPPENGYPDSKDPLVSEMWKNEVGEENYKTLISAWRINKPIKDEG